ncbi:MAG TPA: hypothetical protein DDZ88_03150 [Verrucomicrobiales bacterium]|nr:hypothetical protein [Verrucomicrobiales bacterium]
MTSVVTGAQFAMNVQNIRSFCVEQQIPISPLFASKLQGDQFDFVVEIVSHTVNLARLGIPGAFELVHGLAQADDSNLELDRSFENSLTEAFAVWFLETRQGAKIKAVEARSLPVRSPHARNPNKSCDLMAEMNSHDIYFEVKDCSLDFGPSRTTGRRGYTPASDKDTRKWLEKQIKECFNKGANYLIARLPVWESSSCSGLDAIRQVLCEHEVVSQDCASVEMPFQIPAWFKGVFLIKRYGHVFVSVTQKSRIDTSNELPS